MQIPVCHHFWKNGENAQWAPALFPAPEIEAQIKNDYQALAARRPPSAKYGAYTVFLDYRPGRDIFGRAIMPISFAFYKNFPDDPALAAKIQAALARTPNTQFSLDLHEAPKKEAMPLKRKKKYLWLIPAIVLFVVVVFWLFGRNAPENTPEVARKVELPQKLSPQGAGPQAGGEPARQSGAGTAEFRQTGEQTGEQSGRLPLQHPQGETGLDVCSRPDLWGALLKCPRLFVEMRCNGETTLAFRQFRQKNEACRPAYGKIAPWSPDLPLFRESAEIGRDEARALERFLRK